VGGHQAPGVNIPHFADSDSVKANTEVLSVDVHAEDRMVVNAVHRQVVDPIGVKIPRRPAHETTMPALRTVSATQAKSV
jgi:hypothetical protein